MFEIFLPFIILLIGNVQHSQAQFGSQEVGYRGDCRNAPCNALKGLVCTRSYVCECKMDEITHYPWVFVERMDKCIAMLRDSGRSYGGGDHGGYNPNPGYGGGEHGGFNPNPGGQGCTTLNSHCRYSSTCQQEFGNLANCKLHSQDQSLNRCQCCHPTAEIGFTNGRCYLLKRVGEQCDSNEECFLGSANSFCRNGICAYRRGDRNGGIITTSTVMSIIITIGAAALLIT